MPLQLGKLTFGNFTPDPQEALGTCPLCLEDLGDSEQNLVAHKGMGQKHPLHEECIQEIAKKNFVNCPVCRATTDPTSWKERFFSKITRLAKPAASLGLRSVTWMGLACGLTYMCQGVGIGGSEPMPLSLAKTSLLGAALMGGAAGCIGKKIEDSAHAAGGRWAAFGRWGTALTACRTATIILEASLTGYAPADPFTLPLTLTWDMAVAGLAGWITVIGATALEALEEQH